MQLDRTLFFRMVLRKFSEVTDNKPVFSKYNIFSIYEYFFFQSAFWIINNHQRSQSNQEKCSLCYSLSCFLILLCTHYGSLQCFSTYFHFMAHIFRLCYFLWLWQDISKNKQSLTPWHDALSSSNMFFPFSITFAGIVW